MLMTGFKMKRFSVWFMLMVAFASVGCTARRGASKEEQFIPLERGMAVIQSTPPDASVYINGALVGKTPQKKLFLIPGTYDLEIRKEGFGPWKEKILILENTVHEIQAKLPGFSPTDTPVLKRPAERLY